ncbi:MAG: HIT family protein [Janthinobacterium sp.]|jgi:histidine triad (HIT) family protein
MFSHLPPHYTCPICLGVQGIENEHTFLKQADLVYKNEHVSAFINSFWVGNNKGHVILVPNQHFENIYDLPDDIGCRIFEAARKVSLGLKAAYQCDGITLRQNNEPASDQHAFHYHLHIFPRYDGDDFNVKMTEKSQLSDPVERLKYSQKLKDYFKEINNE